MRDVSEHFENPRPPGPLSTAELFELDGSVKLDLKEGLNEEHGYHVRALLFSEWLRVLLRR